MAALTSRDASSLQVLVDWEHAAGVSAPELAATWCRLEIVAAGRPVTLVEDARGGEIRRAVHTSAYPLAEWIATHWWSLREHTRPSATSSRGWTWARNRHQPWLRSHNTRAAGDGMPWPDLTFVPEGAVTRVVWTAAAGLHNQPVSYLTSGDAYLSGAAVRQALARFVEQVLERLNEARVSDSLLQQEWRALGALDADETDFVAAAARLGLDPFDVDDKVAQQLEALAREYEPDLLRELLDSADPRRLADATRWLERARVHMALRPAVRLDRPPPASREAGYPWEYGYELARAYRSAMGLQATDRIELRDLVGLTRETGDAAGVQGLVVAEESLGLALPEDSTTSPTATRFALARALGVSLLTTRTMALLDPTRNDLTKSTRAFAAELLAPAEGIAEYLGALPAVTDRAIDAVADRFDASPVLVQRQHENQLA